MLTTSPLWLLVSQSDAITWAILLVLLTMSVIGWSVALYKWTQLNSLLRQAQAAIHAMEHKRTREDLERTVHVLHQYGGGRLLSATAHFVEASNARYQQHHDLHQELTMLHTTLNSALSEEIFESDAYTSILRTCAEAAPLLGLLGTIWGLIHSFMRISSERIADIVTVAPGIAEALITTLMGLLVAIPALFFFHIIHRKLQMYEQMLCVLADRCEYTVQCILERQ